MIYCKCEKPLPPSNPRRKDCNRCGKCLSPTKPRVSRPLIYHCARCKEELHPGHEGAMWSELLRAPGGDLTCDHFARFCPPCTRKVLECAVSYGDRSPVT